MSKPKRDVLERMESHSEKLRDRSEEASSGEREWYYEARKKNWRAIDKQIGAGAEIKT